MIFDAATGDYVAYDPNRRFILARIPFAWMWRANRLPGRASAVGVSLWFIAGVRKSRTFKVSAEAVDLAGCGRKALYAGLTALERAGLVSVLRRRGARAIVTILEAEPPPGKEAGISALEET